MWYFDVSDTGVTLLRPVELSTVQPRESELNQPPPPFPSGQPDPFQPPAGPSAQHVGWTGQSQPPVTGGWGAPEQQAATSQFPAPPAGQFGAPGQFQPHPQQGAPGQWPAPGQQSAPGGKPWFRRKRVLIPAAVLGLGIIGAAVSGPSGSDRTSVAGSTSTASSSSAPVSSVVPPPSAADVVATTTPAPVTTPAAPPAVTTTAAPPVVTTPAPPPAPNVSVSQANAVRTANDYLDYMAFSRSGLIGQLEYEGYSTEDATYAVDTITVDWNQQAAETAMNYLEYTSFSRSGLIDQLLYEGFTAEQAEYGVSQTGL